MNKWNGKRFSIYDKEEKQVLGLLNNLGEQTNFNTDEVERLTISDNKKVSHEEMKNKYKIDENANFTGSWFGIKRPSASNEGMAGVLDQLTDIDVPNIYTELSKRVNKNQKILYIKDFLSDTMENAFIKCIESVGENGAIIVLTEDFEITQYIYLPSNITLLGSGNKITYRKTGRILVKNDTIILNIKFINTLETDNTTGARRCIEMLNEEGQGFKNLYISNCYFENFFYSVACRPSSIPNLSKNENVIITNNIFKSMNNKNNGHINIWYTKNVTITNNICNGGYSCSSIGVTGCSGNVIISNNHVSNCTEASIQIENFASVDEEESDINCIISNNVVDGAIWLDDCSNVNCSNNICDSIQVTYQTEIIDDIIINGNKTGIIACASVYTPNDIALGKTIFITNNLIVGAKGLWRQAKVKNDYGIFTSSKILNAIITNNIVKSNVFTSDILVTVNNAEGKYKISNNIGEINLFGTQNAKVEFMGKSYLERFYTSERPTTSNYIGRMIWDSNLAKPIFYQKANTWVDANGNIV